MRGGGQRAQGDLEGQEGQDTGRETEGAGCMQGWGQGWGQGLTLNQSRGGDRGGE